MLRIFFSFVLLVIPVAATDAVDLPDRSEDSDFPAKTWADAVKAIQEKRWDAAIGYFGPRLEARPDDFFAQYLLGTALHGQGRYNEALRAHFIAARFSQVRGAASFNAARSYARLGQREMALMWLERALMAGFDDFAGLRNEADFAALKKEPRFEQIVRRARSDSGHRMPVGTPHYVSPYDRIAEQVTVRTIGGELPFGTGGIAVSAAGEIYAADFDKNVYRIDPTGNRSDYVAGIDGASGNAFDSRGNLYQAHFRGDRISRITPDGEISDFATGGPLNGPVGIAVDANDNLYVANCDGQNVSKIDRKGELTLFSRSPLFYCPNGITIDDTGHVYVANYHHGVIARISPDGEARFFRQMPQEGAAYILFLNGALYVTGSKSHRIFKLDMDGVMSIVAGSGQRGLADGAGPGAMFGDSNGLAASPNGNCLYTNDGLGDWRDSNSPEAFPWHSALREIKLDPDLSC